MVRWVIADRSDARGRGNVCILSRDEDKRVVERGPPEVSTLVAAYSNAP